MVEWPSAECKRSVMLGDDKISTGVSNLDL